MLNPTAQLGALVFTCRMPVKKSATKAVFRRINDSSLSRSEKKVDGDRALRKDSCEGGRKDGLVGWLGFRNPQTKWARNCMEIRKDSDLSPSRRWSSFCALLFWVKSKGDCDVKSSSSRSGAAVVLRKRSFVWMCGRVHDRKVDCYCRVNPLEVWVRGFPLVPPPTGSGSGKLQLMYEFT